jgi:hypothetical protein
MNVPTAVIAAVREAATEPVIEVHAGCKCTRIDGEVLTGIDTVLAVESYGMASGFDHIFCEASAQG